MRSLTPLIRARWTETTQTRDGDSTTPGQVLPLMGTVVLDCRIDHEAVVEHSLLCDHTAVGRGTELRRAILDKGSASTRAPGRVRPGHDREPGFVISDDGITRVPEGAVVGGE